MVPAAQGAPSVTSEGPERLGRLQQVDTWVDQYKSHANFSYIFHENARDVLNKQNPESVKRTLTYLATRC